MAKIIGLEIKNFRGIKYFNEKFDDDFICFVARGDSGKSTLLDAINLVLSSSWSASFFDTDFFNCDISQAIEITITLAELPVELLTEGKFGLHLRSFSSSSCDISDDIKDGDTPVLTIRLSIDRSLEPNWTVINREVNEGIPIRSVDRAKLKCFMISDYIDRHFSWDRGNPLYSLLNQGEKNLDKTDHIVDAMRGVKSEIDKLGFKNLHAAMDVIETKAAQLGLDLSEINTTIDFRDLYIRDSRVCLHEDNIPLRMKGKGSKRLASIAIQSSIASDGGIMLIDEIEQGLEPDRVKQLTRSLLNDYAGQLFITTHSREVITELPSKNLRFVKNENGLVSLSPIQYTKEELQKVVRACPEAFFAKKIIVCEGATEVGICRAMDKYRVSKNRKSLAFNDCAYIDGTGSSFVERVDKIREVGFEVSVLCDSDLPEVNQSKVNWRSKNIEVFDCDVNVAPKKGNSIEQQVFQDLPWSGVIELVKYVKEKHYKTDSAFNDSLSSKYSSLSSDWESIDDRNVREALASCSVVWFKSIHQGEKLGEFLFKYLDDMADTKLGKTLTALTNWVG